MSSVDWTIGIRLPGKSLIKESELDKAVEFKNDTFLIIGRIKLNRKKQKNGIEGLRYTFGIFSNENSIKPVFVEAAISGLFAVFFDCRDNDYFRIKNNPDIMGAR